jgi:hypothetical protein
MARHLRLRELLVGVEGLALLRQLFDRDDDVAEARLAEVRRLMEPAGDATLGAGLDVPELGVTEGYGRWAATYDRPGNPLIAVEQMRFVPDAASAAYLGMPGALVWDLVRR